MGTDSRPGPEPGSLANELHRLRSTLARLRGELEVLELDGRAPGREVFVALDETFEWLGRVEAAALGPFGRVLVVDDDARLAELTADRLRRLGFEVEVAADVASAVGRMGRDDRLVVDYGVIADVSAAEVARLSLESRMIVVSGAVSDAARAHAMELGAVAFLVKPFEMVELARLLRMPAAGRQ